MTIASLPGGHVPVRRRDGRRDEWDNGTFSHIHLSDGE
jgi:hypothetical protein